MESFFEEHQNVLLNEYLTSPLFWISHPYNPIQYKDKINATPIKIKEKILNCSRIIDLIQNIIEEYGENIQNVRLICNNIISEMGHNLNIRDIRILGFMLSLVFSKIFDGLYYNHKAIKNIKTSIHKYPVVFLPNHRSYFDFLIISYICFLNEINIPCIASTTDFLSIKLISELLRGCGAFFIKRNFKKPKITDKVTKIEDAYLIESQQAYYNVLYKAILEEYVKHLMISGHTPLEFFLEGTRSRSLKNLPPKIGLLSMVYKTFLSGHVSDVHIFPITINYDKVLEDFLFVKELLGIPKPRETAKSLMKVIKRLFLDTPIHSSNSLDLESPSKPKFYCGNAYVTFHNVISLREHLDPLRRKEFVQKRYMSFDSSLNPYEIKAIKLLAQSICDTLASPIPCLEEGFDLSVLHCMINLLCHCENTYDVNEFQTMFTNFKHFLIKSYRYLNEGITHEISKDDPDYSIKIKNFPNTNTSIQTSHYFSSLFDIGIQYATTFRRLLSKFRALFPRLISYDPLNNHNGGEAVITLLTFLPVSRYKDTPNTYDPNDNFNVKSERNFDENYILSHLYRFANDRISIARTLFVNCATILSIKVELDNIKELTSNECSSITLPITGMFKHFEFLWKLFGRELSLKGEDQSYAKKMLIVSLKTLYLINRNREGQTGHVIFFENSYSMLSFQKNPNLNTLFFPEKCEFVSGFLRPYIFGYLMILTLLHDGIGETNFETTDITKLLIHFLKTSPNTSNHDDHSSSNKIGNSFIINPKVKHDSNEATIGKSLNPLDKKELINWIRINLLLKIEIDPVCRALSCTSDFIGNAIETIFQLFNTEMMVADDDQDAFLGAGEGGGVNYERKLKELKSYLCNLIGHINVYISA